MRRISNIPMPLTALVIALGIWAHMAEGAQTVCTDAPCPTPRAEAQR